MSILYRVLIVTSIFMSALWYFQPYSVSYDSSVETLYAWVGYGGTGWVLTKIVPVILISSPIALIGMFFYVPYSRNIYFLVCLVNLIVAPFAGVSVQVGVDIFLNYLLSMIDGVLIYMSFFTSVGDNYKKSTQLAS